MRTFFVSDFSRQVVGVGLGLQDPYPVFHGRDPLGVKEVLRQFLHFYNGLFNPCGQMKGCPEGVSDDFWH